MQGVYFVADKNSDAIKIGFSDNIENRMRGFFTSNPNELELVAVWHNATISDEKRLHVMFKRSRIKGEWFVLDDVIPFIQWFAGYNPDFSILNEKLETIHSSLVNPVEYREKVFTWFSDHDKQVQSSSDMKLRLMMLLDGIIITPSGFTEMKSQYQRWFHMR